MGRLRNDGIGGVVEQVKAQDLEARQVGRLARKVRCGASPVACYDRTAMARTPPPDLIRLDTLGKLYVHGHGIGGYCLTCQKLFAVDMVELLRERGRDCRIVDMKPLICTGCEGKRTQYSITVLPKAPPPDVA
jgi:hypothetical protein